MFYLETKSKLIFSNSLGQYTFPSIGKLFEEKKMFYLWVDMATLGYIIIYMHYLTLDAVNLNINFAQGTFNGILKDLSWTFMFVFKSRLCVIAIEIYFHTNFMCVYLKQNVNVNP